MGQAGAGNSPNHKSWADDALQAALAEAHVPSLVNALVHLTGDASLIRGDMRPASQLFGDPQGGISAADQAAVRQRAFAALCTHRDAGFPALPPPTPELVKEMVDFIVGAELGEGYGEFLMSELKVFDDDPYSVSFNQVPSEAKAQFHVVVVGAGMSGILAAIRLRQAGIRHTVIEKNADVGGTWFENRYPGCRVDSPNHTYSYSFAPNDWPQHFSPQRVLLEYFDRIATEYGIRANIRFRTEVVEARYVADGAWQVQVRGPDGVETLTANAIISSVGQLNRPKLPDIEGVGSFDGPAFHTAQWQAEHDLADKRIVVIGTGASAFQTVPEIARTARRVTVFQRTPPWVAPRAEYHDDITSAKHWLLNNVPFYGKWFRFWTFWTTAEGLLGMVKRDPAWNEERSVSAANDQLRAMLTANVEQMVGDDPELFGQVRAAVSAGRQAHAGGQRPLVPSAQARQRGTGDGPHRLHQPLRRADAIRAAGGCGRADLRHRLPGQPHPLSDAHLRQGRRRAARALGRRPARLSRHRDARLSQPVLLLRAEHQHRRERQHHLLLGVRSALHHGLLEAADRARPRDDGLPRRRA